jgi:hypothetical protein
MLGLLLTVGIVWIVVTAALWGVLLMVIVAERLGLLHSLADEHADVERLRVQVESGVAED